MKTSRKPWNVQMDFRQGEKKMGDRSLIWSREMEILIQTRLDRINVLI